MVPFRALFIGDAATLQRRVDWEIRSWPGIDVVVPGPLAGRPFKAARLGLAAFDTSPLLWADALVVGASLGGAGQALLEAIAADPSLLRGRALISDTDPGLWRGALSSARATERLALRAADVETARELDSARSAASPDPLVSVILVCHDEPVELVDRAIASAMDADARVEIVVAGPSRPQRPDVHWVQTCGGWAERYEVAVDAARGAWIAPLDGRSVFAEGHIRTLLEVAVEHDLDVVYGQALLVDGGEVVGVAGDWPPTVASLAHDAVLYRAVLRGVRPDPGCAAEGEDPRWNLWRRWLEAGVRIANVEVAVTLRDLSAGSRSALGDAA
jgi:hypothetical protein